MKIDIRETLHFFDDKQSPELKGHTSGVMGVIGEDLNAAVFTNDSLDPIRESVLKRT